MTCCGRVHLMMLAGLLLIASTANAVQLNIASETILRGFQRERTDRTKLNALPVYEYLQLTYATKKEVGLSLHINGWGRLNLADDYNRNNTDGTLLHAYLQYAPPKQNYQLRAGRQYIFEGVARENLDGIHGKLFALPRTTFSAYAGVPTMLDNQTGRKNDLIYGGKISYGTPTYDVGLSYKHILDNGGRREQLLGGDLAVNFTRKITLLGHSTYDLIDSGWGEHSYEMRFPVGPIAFQPFLQRYTYTSYFSNTRNSVPPFRFLEGSGNTLTTAGTDIYWYPSDRGEVVLRFKNYDYKNRFKPSQYYSLLINRRWQIFSEAGGEVARMQGSESNNRYLLTRAYLYWKFAPGFITSDIMYVIYDQRIYGKSSSLFASIGVGTGFLKDTLNLKLSCDYSQDPYLKSDFRFMVKLNYLLDRSFGLSSGTENMQAFWGSSR